jgi:hypothetical protein
MPDIVCVGLQEMVDLSAANIIVSDNSAVVWSINSLFFVFYVSIKNRSKAWVDIILNTLNEGQLSTEFPKHEYFVVRNVNSYICFV